MKRGRRKAVMFSAAEQHINEMATRASNKGAYTVQSLREGMVYLADGDYITIATGNGCMTCKMEIAELIANELGDVIAEVKQHRREKRKLMDARHIGKMLEANK